MSKSFIESIIPFITSMRKGVASEDAPVVSLIPFEKGQIIKGLDFGNVKNGQVDSALEEILYANTEDDATWIMCYYDPTDEGEHSEYLLNGYAWNGMAIILLLKNKNTPIVLYCSEAFEEQGMVVTKGWQNLENGKVFFDNPQTIEEVNYNTTISEDMWNGVVVGAIEE